MINIDWAKLDTILENGTATDLTLFLSENELSISNGKIVANDKEKVKFCIDHWDRRQTIKKLNLNSAYGSLLNEHARFFDQRLGQSTTLSGRQVVKHMSAKTNETITSEYNHTGSAIIYGDTDSSFFTAYESFKSDIDAGNIIWNKDTVIELYNEIANIVNASFPDFMYSSFHIPHNKSVIKAGRELVGTRGLYITKKRYGMIYYDKDGKRTDSATSVGKIKAMGLDLKRSDTPKYVQEFLMSILEAVLTTGTEETILAMIDTFRSDTKNRPSWEKGTPKRVNNLSKFKKKIEAGKTTTPGHVTASLNWNLLKQSNHDHSSMSIIDGSKIIVCKLKSNALGMTSVAYPIDELRLPQWFKDLPFDDLLMEETIIDNKLDNLLGVLNWDLGSNDAKNTFASLFDF